MLVHFTPDLQAKIAQLADRRGQDSESIVVEAMERVVDYDNWFVSQVELGLEKIERGDTLSHLDVSSRMEKYLASKKKSS